MDLKGGDNKTWKQNSSFSNSPTYKDANRDSFLETSIVDTITYLCYDQLKVFGYNTNNIDIRRFDIVNNYHKTPSSLMSDWIRPFNFDFSPTLVDELNKEKARMNNLLCSTKSQSSFLQCIANHKWM